MDQAREEPHMALAELFNMTNVDAATWRAPPPNINKGKQALLTTSELWQRLRAARKHAELRQQDIADATGKARPTVACWESSDPLNRTQVEIDDLKVIAKRCKLKLAFFLDDNANPGEVHRWAATPGDDSGMPANEPNIGTDASAQRKALLGLDDSRAANFWGAVEFNMSEKGRDMRQRFARHLNPHFPDYTHADHIVVFAGDAADAKCIMVGALGVMLHTEKLAARAFTHHVLVYAGHGGRKDINEKEALRLWGVHVKQVDTIKEATAYLHTL